MRTFVISLAVIASAGVYAQPVAFERGDMVRVKAVADGSASATNRVLQVVAIAGDRIRPSNGTLYVNDVAVEGFSRDFLSRVVQQPERTPSVVPAGHCFVMGERRTNQDISEYWGQHSIISLERAQ